jgi:hypothetical protein
LELLGYTDGDHARLAGSLEVGTDQVDLTVVLTEAYDRDLVPRGETGNGPAKFLTHLLEHGRRCDGLTTMHIQERRDLAAHLQRRNVRIQIHPIQTLEVKRNMPVQNLVDMPTVATQRYPGLKTSPT